MDEDRSSTHDPAARLGRASDVPDGIERLAGPPATPDRPEAPAFSAGSGNRGGGNGAAAATEVAEPVARPAADTDADSTNGHIGADDDVDIDDGHDSDDPPPRWAGGREPGSTPPPGPAEPTVAEQPARRPGGRSAYWAAAVLVIFGAIAAIGLVKSGGDDPEPSAAQDRGETTATTAADDEGGEDEAARPSGEKPSTSVEDQTTTTTAGAQAPAVGECAVLDVAPEPDEYIQVPCDAPTAAVQLSQVVPSPAPAGSHCPQGTDTVAQVTADASVGRAAPELWCLRNVAAPHPGDPGGGGGELVVGDCLGAAPSGQSIEVPCDGTGLPPEYLVGWLPDANGVCPAESVATVNLATPFPGAYCLRYKP